MKNSIIVSFAVIFGLYACASPESGPLPENDTIMDNELEKGKVNFLNSDTLHINLLVAGKRSNLILRGFNKSFDSTIKYLDADEKACANWFLSREEIRKIFKYCKPITGTEWDLGYATLPCSYSGNVELNGNFGNYELNAGSYAILKFSDTAIYFGFTMDSIGMIFLSPPN